LGLLQGHTNTANVATRPRQGRHFGLPKRVVFTECAGIFLPCCTLWGPPLWREVPGTLQIGDGVGCWGGSGCGFAHILSLPSHRLVPFPRGEILAAHFTPPPSLSGGVRMRHCGANVIRPALPLKTPKLGGPWTYFSPKVLYWVPRDIQYGYSQRQTPHEHF
jgi:hypothetical protein